MGSKVRERPKPMEMRAHDAQCPVGNPRPKGTIAADRLWAWSRAHPQLRPFRD
jgi:hypothetical protein